MNTRSPKLPLTLTYLLSATLFAGAAAAAFQDGTATAAAQKTDGTFVRLNTVGESSVFTSMGESPQELGQISDLIVDCRSGRTTHAVIGGDTVRLLELSDAQWQADKQRFVTRMSAADFEALPEFDEETFQQEFRDAVKASARIANQDKEIGDLNDDGKVTAREAAAALPMRALANTMAGWHVSARGEQAGEVGDVYLDVAGGSIAFLSFASEADGDERTFVVPFSTLRILPPRAGDGSPMFELNRGREFLAGAPYLMDDEDAVLNDRRFRDRVRSFYEQPRIHDQQPKTPQAKTPDRDDD